MSPCEDMDLIKRKLAACLEQSTEYFKVMIIDEEKWKK
jgi:hypothetical protein